MQGFRGALDFCRLKDLGFNGYSFTCCNRRLGDQNVWVRLDRGVATVEWILHFPTSQIHHLDAFHSDHKPILLCSDSEFKHFYKKGRPFRFEAMWIKDKTCEAVIQEAWAGHLGNSPVQSFNQKIDMCQVNLRNWNRTSFGHVRNLLSKKLKDLKWAEESDECSTNPSRIHQLQNDIEALKSKEECMWKQRSRNSWLKEGDRNTKFFHCRANRKNKRNHILGLSNEAGVWVEE
ncbi:uncharacterized protein LOC142608777 [Castanea sativa]|uniref:uncharacterized protein LOC142608777 n=1 Tax=Castanea sativa TaxID=21020 RepID=UPI003F64B4A7